MFHVLTTVNLLSPIPYMFSVHLKDRAKAEILLVWALSKDFNTPRDHHHSPHVDVLP